VKNLHRRPRYQRAEDPPPMRFQERDGLLIQALFDYEILARRHIKRMFWPYASTRAMEMRLSLLYHNGYINWPNEQQRRTKPVPEPVIWLGWRGAVWLASQFGLDVSLPKRGTEHYLRTYAKDLREEGFRWLREPRWMQLKHDLAIIDLRFAVEEAANGSNFLKLEEWIPEGFWLSDHDVIEYQVKARDGEILTKKKGVRPDGYFSIVDHAHKIKGSAVRSRFLLEIDMSTHPRLRFGREKAAPGVAYIRSPEYKERFGYQSGRWLVVTTGEKRMKNLIQHTKKEIGPDAKSFLFTTISHLTTANVLSDPIWYRFDRDEPLGLFPNR